MLVTQRKENGHAGKTEVNRDLAFSCRGDEYGARLPAVVPELIYKSLPDGETKGDKLRFP